MSLYTLALRPALFSLDAERAHDLTMAALRQPLLRRALRLAPAAPVDARLRQHVMGIEFAHPLGLAAGLDKQGSAVDAWSAIGFAFAEVGTVTPQPQPGNGRPRLFRLPRHGAVINRFGFNSDGAAQVARHLASAGRMGGPPLGINIGKNRETPNDRAADDCLRVVDALHPFADYFVINVSSPNTERLRDLQQAHALRALVEAVTSRTRTVAADRAIPVLVKVSPDAEPADLLHSVEAALEGGAAGIVATNTTVARPAVSAEPLAREAGGLSGAPLRSAANAACRLLFQHLGRRVPIVGVGGIGTPDDAYERIRSGATLLQLYTALIYDGPGVVRRIVRGLADLAARDGFATIGDAIGADVRS